jgi:hypothetical protein
MIIIPRPQHKPVHILKVIQRMLTIPLTIAAQLSFNPSKSKFQLKEEKKSSNVLRKIPNCFYGKGNFLQLYGSEFVSYLEFTKTEKIHILATLVTNISKYLINWFTL